MSQHVFRPSTFPGSSMDPVERGVLPMRSAAYGSEDISGFGARNVPISGLTAGFTRGYSTSIEDPILKVPQREHSVGINPVLPANPDSIYERPATQPRVPDMIYERPATQPRIPDMIYERPAAQPRIPDMIYERPAPQPRVPDMVYERPASQPMVDGLSAPPVLSNILFVDGLPTDCTRREVGHIFRPFIGFKDIKVIHKEPRRSGDKAMVLCFVEFNDAKCALTAMEALQGYKFDDKKPNAPVLKIQFAHFPFRLPSEHGDQRIGTLDSNNQATGR